MIKIENRQVFSDEGKDIHRKGSDVYFKRSMVLPDDTLEDFEEVDEIPKYTKAEYDAKVAELIRQKYSQDEENAIKSKVIASMLPNTLSEETNEKHMMQFAEFNAYREECKVMAKNPDLYNTPDSEANTPKE